MGGGPLLEFPVACAVDTLDAQDESGSLRWRGWRTLADGTIRAEFEETGPLWGSKRHLFLCRPSSLEIRCALQGKNQRINHVNYLLRREGSRERGAQAHHSSAYAPRFDWNKGRVLLEPTGEDSLGCQQWFSPPPFCYGLKLGPEWVAAGIAAAEGEQNFTSFDYRGRQGLSLTLSYEGHTAVQGEFTTPGLIFCFGASEENAAVARYVEELKTLGLVHPSRHEPAAWWAEPIFCGWGQQRFDYRRDHGGSENGSFINVGSYASEAAYRHYLSVLEDHGLNPGTVIVDFEWAEHAALGHPDPRRWVNMRGFIDEQHNKGRRVLLWYAPLFTWGLPPEACMTLDGRPVAADPTSPAWRRIAAAEVRRMISPEAGCLNADGFKIDFTQCVPSEVGPIRCHLDSKWSLLKPEAPHSFPPLGRERGELIRTHGNKWGAEMLRELISHIHGEMKRAKPDALLITHTANPAFAGVVDALRLNDLNGLPSADALEIMTNRAAIAKACNPGWLIDTDNDLMSSKQMWRAYVELQPRLGIPDSYYAYGIAESGEAFGPEDWAHLARVWANYRRSLTAQR